MSKIQNIQERPNISETWKEIEQTVKTIAEVCNVHGYIPEKQGKCGSMKNVKELYMKNIEPE